MCGITKLLGHTLIDPNLWNWEFPCIISPSSGYESHLSHISVTSQSHLSPIGLSCAQISFVNVLKMWWSGPNVGETQTRLSSSSLWEEDPALCHCSGSGSSVVKSLSDWQISQDNNCGFTHCFLLFDIKWLFNVQFSFWSVCFASTIKNNL